MNSKHTKAYHKVAAGLLALVLSASTLPANTNLGENIISVKANAEVTESAPVSAAAELASGFSISSRNIYVNVSLSGTKFDKDTKVILDGEDIPYTVKNGELTFNLECAPKKISDEHSLTVKSGSKVLLDRQISAKELLNGICDTDSELKSAAENMLRYGSAAQKYFNYNETVPADEGIAPAKDAKLPADGFDNASFNASLKAMKAPVTYDGMSICFDKDLTLKMLFSAAEGSDLKKAEDFVRSSISLKDSEVTRNGNKICIVKSNIGIRELDKKYPLTLGQEKLEVSVSQFIANVMAEKGTDEDTVELKELCKSLYSLYTSVEKAPENYTEPVKEETKPVSSTTSTTTTTTTTAATTTTTSSDSGNKATTTTVPKTPDPVDESLINPTSIKGIYSYKLDEKLTSTPYLYVNDDKILLAEPNETEYLVQLYDMNSGKLLAEGSSPTAGEYDYKTYTLCDNCIIEIENSSTLKYYDLSFNELKTIDLGFEAGDEIRYNYVDATSSSGKYVFYTSTTPTMSMDEDPIVNYYIYDTENDERNEICSDYDFFNISYNEKDECFDCSTSYMPTENTVVKIALDGTVSETNYIGAEGYSNGKAFNYTSTGMYISNYDGSDAKFVYYDIENEPPYNTNGKYAVSINRNTRIYDLENNLVSDPFKSGGTSAFEFADDNRIFFVGREYNGTPFLKVLKTEEFEIKNPLRTETNVDISEPEKMIFKNPYGSDPELDVILKEIYDRYNIKVFFELTRQMGNKWNNYVYESYYGDKVNKARELLDYLNNWPDDIARQVTNYQSEMWIVICEEFHPEVVSSENIDPAGIATTYDGKPLIVAEAYDDDERFYRGTLSHEFIHILDQGIDYETLDAWTDLSPEDGYLNSFANYYSVEDYISGYESDLSNVYFLDGYGRVNPEEDRARIGEYLWYSYEDQRLESSFGSEHVRAKAERLVSMFRDRYSCLEEVEEGELYLEKALSLPLAEYYAFTYEDDGYYHFG
ncbi:MAG: hypothetical protein GXY08_00365 [Ruminococcus sp.]|nr:hypothetical protein [Ruminococcus sp.]